MLNSYQYARSRYSAAYPQMDLDGEEFKELVDSMRRDGFWLDYPITLFEGEIVDGWHRYLAALEANVEPIFVEFPVNRVGDDLSGLLNFINDRNLARRHVTKGQKAAILLGMDQFNSQGNKTPLDVIAKRAGVLAETVNNLVKIRRLNPEMFERVRLGQAKVGQTERSVLGVRPSSEIKKSPRRTFAIPTNLVDKIEEAATILGITTERFVSQALKSHLQHTASDVEERRIAIDVD